MKQKVLLLVLSLLLIFSVSEAQMRKTIKQGTGFKYIEYLPPVDSVPRGIILYLHGLGERGTDPNLLERNEIPKLFKNGVVKNYVVICPQLPSTATSFYKVNIIAYLHLIDSYNIAKKHITGLSLGGMGTYSAILYSWDYNNKQPGYFKTACSLAGKSSTKEYIKFTNTAVKIYHGNLDKTIGISADRNLFHGLFDYGIDVEMKEYRSDHNVWTVGYNDTKDGYWYWLKSKE